MKIRLLPEIDLARISPMPSRQKENELRKLKQKRPPYSYAPTRKQIFDIFHIESGFMHGTPRTKWNTIAQLIAKEARSADECLANLRVSKALYDFAIKEEISGRKQEFTPLTVGVSQRIAFWHPAVIALDAKPTIIFTDPRISSAKLTGDGRKFVFSVMHERIRVAEPDFASVELAIIQFRKLEDKTRTVILHQLLDSDLFSFVELDLMIRETYDIWTKIQIERIEESRRKGTGTTGPLV